MNIRYILVFVLIFIFNSFAYAAIDLWFTQQGIDSDNMDVHLWAKSTTTDLTQIDGVQWGIAFVSSEDRPLSTLVFDFAPGDWSPSISYKTFSMGSYDSLLSYIGAGSQTTITSASGGTKLATIRFQRVGSWGNIHLVTDTESPSWGCYISNNLTLQTLNYPGDMALPVAVSNITAEASQEEGVVINWVTQSEVNSAGFEVWRSLSEKGNYSKITTAIIQSQGNTSVAQEYSFTDINVENGITYWYKVEEISMDGKSEWFGPISVQGIKPIPTEYDLAQNYPNPFNPETTIKYQLPEDAEVKIIIYSILGQEVKTLINEPAKAGYHEVMWYGKNNSGVKVPSGMYIVQMQAEDFRQTRKMTIIR